MVVTLLRPLPPRRRERHPVSCQIQVYPRLPGTLSPLCLSAICPSIPTPSTADRDIVRTCCRHAAVPADSLCDGRGNAV